GLLLEVGLELGDALVGLGQRGRGLLGLGPGLLVAGFDGGELIAQTRDRLVALAQLRTELVDIGRLPGEGLGLVREPGELLVAGTQQRARLGLRDLDRPELAAELLDLARTLLLLGPRALDLLAEPLDLAADPHAVESLFLQGLAGLPDPRFELLELAVA